MRPPVLVVLLIALLPAATSAQKLPFPQKGGIEAGPRVLRKQIIIPRVNQGPDVIAVPRLSFTKQLKDEHIELKSGDIFRGSFGGFDPKTGIMWNHPHVSPQLKITPTHIKHIQFGGNQLPSEAKNHSSKVTLINGDGLSGDLISLKGGKLTVDTWYGGEIQIEPSVAVHVGDRDAIAVVIVNGLPVLARLVGNLVAKADTAFFNLVRKGKLVIDLILPR